VSVSALRQSTRHDAAGSIMTRDPIGRRCSPPQRTRGYASAFGVVLTQSDGKSSAISVPRLRLFKPMIPLKLRGSLDVESVKGMKHVSAVLLWPRRMRE
jgi:hypothetical protein